MRVAFIAVPLRCCNTHSLRTQSTARARTETNTITTPTDSLPKQINARHASVKLAIAQITRPKRDGGVKVVDMCWLEACIYAPHCE